MKCNTEKRRENKPHRKRIRSFNGSRMTTPRPMTVSESGKVTYIGTLILKRLIQWWYRSSRRERFTNNGTKVAVAKTTMEELPLGNHDIPRGSLLQSPSTHWTVRYSLPPRDSPNPHPLVHFPTNYWRDNYAGSTVRPQLPTAELRLTRDSKW